MDFLVKGWPFLSTTPCWMQHHNTTSWRHMIQEIQDAFDFFAPKFWEVTGTYEWWFCPKMNVAWSMGTITGGGDTQTLLDVLKKFWTFCTLRRWWHKNFGCEPSHSRPTSHLVEFPLPNIIILRFVSSSTERERGGDWAAGCVYGGSEPARRTGRPSAAQGREGDADSAQALEEFHQIETNTSFFPWIKKKKTWNVL